MFIEDRLNRLLFDFKLLNYKILPESELDFIRPSYDKYCICFPELQVQIYIKVFCILDEIVYMDVCKSQASLYLGLLTRNNIIIRHTGIDICTVTCKRIDYNKKWIILKER